MSVDVHRKLDFLCRAHGVPPDQFVQEFIAAYVKPRRAHVLEWLRGERNPHGRSLDSLVDYWTRYNDGIERFWWSAPYDEFVALYEERRERTSTPTNRMDHAAAAFRGEERDTLCGLYHIYRYRFGSKREPTVELLELEPDQFSGRRIFTRIYTPSHSDERDRLKQFQGYAYRLRDQYYIMAFLASSAEQYLRTMTWSAEAPARPDGAVFALVVGTANATTPVAARAILHKVEIDRETALAQLERQRVPAAYRQLLKRDRIEVNVPPEGAA